ncbi:metal ABC transporter substrate-binding protein [Streptomyces sp. SCUT-3]|uniref:MetQ/NlpA family ABC transporter substrate-binding protein n=2 Tax=Streptomyces TaxID=1883 RepID=UPI000CC04241|nr:MULTISPECIES: MetQ/NlpA family ABC transporter substrate-binding protein [unclassified Streptomyces]MCZ2526428.1 MetQ/NlpA family ABC transporter substrate-binding protein [Streptomyces sp. HB2AG]PLW72241.1 metal ABC transporter substrate-binding protein [Streptomyces sp. DJ]QMV24190.1 metal ABC transporter substrate-binding protein [Streptomyces sp. SCUT-3]
MRNTIKTAAVAAVTGALALGLTACGAGSGSGSSDAADGPLVVAATPVPHAEVLTYIRDNLAKDAGLELEVKEFQDYVAPNTATDEGSVDANYFQTAPYLEEFNKENGTKLTPVAEVHLEPLGLYSDSIRSTGDLKAGATVGIPNDGSNEARALKLLDANGLIELKDGAGENATPKDIAKNPKKLEFKELEAAQLPRSLADLDAAVINGNYAISADLNPAKDALVLEKAENNPYTNLLVVNKGNEDDPRVKKLAKLLTSEEVRKFIEDKYDGSVVPAF